MNHRGSKTKTTFKKSFRWLSLLPFVITVISVLSAIYFYVDKCPSFVNLQSLEAGKLSDTQKQAITMVIELNKYVISLVTLMFGVLGFFLKKYHSNFKVRLLGGSLLLIVLLLLSTYYFAYMTYNRVTCELAQNALAMTPDLSQILFFLEMEFMTSLSSGISMLIIFIFILSFDTTYIEPKNLKNIYPCRGRIS